MQQALAGVRVLEFTSFTAGPLGGAFLAQLGAEVIKIESLDGDAVRKLGYPVAGSSYLFQINNNGKHSTTINIKSEAGRNCVRELVARADILLENVAPGSLARNGLGFKDLSVLNPRLIYCSMSGYGYTGPLAGRRAYDVVVQGLTGLITVTGHGRPVKVGPSITDLTAAAASCASICMALYHQRRTGEGQYIDMSLYDVGAWLTQEAWPTVIAGEQSLPPFGNRHRGAGPQNTYEAGDGRLVAIAAETDAQWQQLCILMDRECLTAQPELRTAVDRSVSDSADRAVAGWVAGLDAAACVERCQSVGVPAMVYMELPEIANHPHVAEREMVVKVTSGDESFLLPGSPLKLSETPGRVHRPAEALGASNDYVFRELLGRSEEEIRKLKADGATD